MDEFEGLILEAIRDRIDQKTNAELLADSEAVDFLCEHGTLANRNC